MFWPEFRSSLSDIRWYRQLLGGANKFPKWECFLLWSSFGPFLVEKQSFWSSFFSLIKWCFEVSNLLVETGYCTKGLIENKVFHSFISFVGTVTSLDQKNRNFKTSFDQRKKSGSKRLFLDNKRSFGSLEWFGVLMDSVPDSSFNPRMWLSLTTVFYDRKCNEHSLKT